MWLDIGYLSQAASRRAGSVRQKGYIQILFRFDIEKYVPLDDYTYAMKTKLTVTLDEELIPKAKRYAKQHNRSLSSLIEESLQSLTKEPEQSFSKQWGGKLKVHPKDDARFQQLAKKYKL